MDKSSYFKLGYKEHTTRFTVADVSGNMTAKQLTELKGTTAWIIKEVRCVFDGTPLISAYVDLNTADTDVEATNIARAYYQSGAFIINDGDGNGPIGGDLTAKPYIQCGGGDGSDVYGTVHYYYK